MGKKLGSEIEFGRVELLRGNYSMDKGKVIGKTVSSKSPSRSSFLHFLPEVMLGKQIQTRELNLSIVIFILN